MCSLPIPSDIAGRRISWRQVGRKISGPAIASTAAERSPRNAVVRSQTVPILTMIAAPVSCRLDALAVDPFLWKRQGAARGLAPSRHRMADRPRAGALVRSEERRDGKEC